MYTSIIYIYIYIYIRRGWPSSAPAMPSAETPPTPRRRACAGANYSSNDDNSIIIIIIIRSSISCIARCVDKHSK